jgi:GNAT superfamily N-acetyltransferase
MALADHTYRVRPASAADLPSVLTILTEHQTTGPPLPVPSAGRPSDRQKAAWERVLATTDLTIYLAEAEAEAVGTASMLLMPHLTYDCRSTAFIEAVVVRYAHRRRGVATRLLQQALGDAHAASCRKSSCCHTSATATMVRTTSTERWDSPPRPRASACT